MKKAFKKAVQEQLDIIQANISKAETADEETIHQLRVGYKKLRALLRVARLEDGGKKLKFSDSFKELYHLAGELRTLQLYHHHITPFYKDGTYPESITDQISKAHQKLKDHISNFDIAKERHRIEKHLPDSLSKSALKKFISEQIKSIHQLPPEKIKDTQLHHLRKILKDITYSLQETDADAKKFFPVAGRKSMRELKKLSDTLNNYQDTVTNLLILDTSDTANLSEQDKTILDGLRKEWEQRKSDIKKELLPLDN